MPVVLAAELRFRRHTALGRLRELSRGGAYFEPLQDELAGEPETEAWLFAPSLGEAVAVQVRSRRLVAGALSGLGLEFCGPGAAFSHRLAALLEPRLR
ncbi:MAG: hypothetical protein KatS3mg102_0274 [Planctomycetota bacterium]|nr:MAG: hypothetical protein KatS3mg102_0274 [Planctomycetota bacterium]